MKSQKIRPNALYIVATPIGNLQDITLRALEYLKKADVIFSEDTRVTKNLLDHYNIRIPKLISCHAYNEQKRIDLLKSYLNAQQITLLVSDAGTPLISDPGLHVVKQLISDNYRVIPIPGVSALTTALSSSVLPTNSFQFRGFFPIKSIDRRNILKSIEYTPMTTVFYESTHRILDTLQEIHSVLPNYKIVVAKELTKKFEEFFVGYSCEILNLFKENCLLKKGEFVILIEGGKDTAKEQISFDEDKLLNILLQEVSISKAAKLAAELTNSNRNRLYKKALIVQNR